jgi:dihydropteroate synthase
MRRLEACGVSREQVVLDAGIGFGKTQEQNLALIADMKRFARHGRPVLLGVSRKSFLGKISGSDVNERLPAALACSILARVQGVGIFRAHDVAATVQALRAADAVLAVGQ